MNYNRIKEEIKKITEVLNNPRIRMEINGIDYCVTSQTFSTGVDWHYVNVFRVYWKDSCLALSNEQHLMLLRTDVERYWTDEDYRFQLTCTEDKILLSRVLYTHEYSRNHPGVCLFPNFNYSYEERMELYDVYLSNL